VGRCCHALPLPCLHMASSQAGKFGGRRVAGRSIKRQGKFESMLYKLCTAGEAGMQ